MREAACHDFIDELLFAGAECVVCVGAAELDAADAEIAHITLRTTGDGATVVKAAGRRVLGKLVQSGPVTGLFESLPLLGVLGDHLGALHLAGFH